jgi:type I restriction enzyme S subunit
MKFEQIGNIVSIHKGKKHEITDDILSSSIRVLQIDDLRNDHLIKYTNDKKGVKANDDDLMIVWDGANAGTVGFGKSGYIGSTIALLRKKHPEKYSTIFLGKFLQSQFSYLRKNTTGATIPHIDRKSLESLKMPVIEFDNQLHIAHILSKSEKLKAQRKESIRLLDEFLKSTFLEMFYSNPKTENWDVVKFEELADKKKGSMRTGPFGSSLLHGEFTDKGDVKVLGIDNVVTNRFDWKRSRCITFVKFQELKRYQVFPNDVLISIMATLGRTAVVPINIPICINSKHLAAITLNKKIANPYFVAYAFHTHPLIVKQMNNNVKGAIMDGLNLTIIKKIKLQLPPVELQDQFGKLFVQIETLKTQFQRSLKELENLNGCLSQRAFRGELSFKEEGLMIAAEPEVSYIVTNLSIPETKRGFAKQVLGGKIVSIFKDDKNFTHIKFQKLQYLAEHYVGEDLLWNYYRQSAGPYDNKFMHNVSDRLKQNKWFEERNFRFYQLEKASDIDRYYQNYFGNKDEHLNKLFSLLKNSSEKFCEAVATIYAVWNNHLILKQNFNAELIKLDFFEWSKRKTNLFTEVEFDKALAWMKKHEIVPTGFGQLIKERLKSKYT